MLFLNRRGFAGFISCRACGFVLKCPHCDISLTYHRGGRMVCHYCGHERPIPKICPECKSKYIAAFGIGTQKVEAALYREFPHARVMRMDLDTTRKKESYDQMLSAFSKGEADILVGTQMIVKGHDFSKVTLMGILAADLSLHSGDFRSGEKTFQLLTQAAGRAGRGERPGKVVIQTYQPEHYAIVSAGRQNYEEFYEQEMTFRRLLKYPPACEMLVIFCTSRDEGAGILALDLIASYLRRIYGPERLKLVGPGEGAFPKINDVYRRVLYIKEEDANVVLAVRQKVEHYIEMEEIFSKVHIYFDRNPMGIY
jgi:primosomal protein N' (replication factor Y)